MIVVNNTTRGAICLGEGEGRENSEGNIKLNHFEHVLCNVILHIALYLTETPFLS